jgi:hypothetical protein
MRELRIRLREAFAEHGILLPGERWAHEAGHDVGLVVKDRTKPAAAAVAVDQDERPEHPTRGDPAEAG